MNPAEAFLNYTEQLFDKEAEIVKGTSAVDGLIEPAVFCFKDVPKSGSYTFVSYGLSIAELPEWKLGRRPELLLTIDSPHKEWGIVLADLISQTRGRVPFSYGHRIDLGQKVEGSNVTQFTVFAPLHLKQEDFLDIDVGQEYKICLNAVYPLTIGESQVIDMIGFENFWKDPNFNLETILK